MAKPIQYYKVKKKIKKKINKISIWWNSWMQNLKVKRANLTLNTTLDTTHCLEKVCHTYYVEFDK